MSEIAAKLWAKANATLNAARKNLEIDTATAGSRAYYAAFYAVSALFALEGETFKKHSAVEAAVHRDLARTGRWSKELATDFSDLARMRTTVDYDYLAEPTREEVERAVIQAERIIVAVRAERPELDAPR